MVKLAGLLVVTLILSAITALPARADTIYSYTGNALTDLTPHFSCPLGCPITGSFTVTHPLAANLHLVPLNPVAFSFTSGALTISNTSPNLLTAYGWISTTSTGQIKSWFLFAEIKTGPALFSWLYSSNLPKNPFHSAFPLSDIMAITTIDPRTVHMVPPADIIGGAIDYNTPGILTLAPETGTLVLLGTGLVSASEMVRRKRRR